MPLHANVVKAGLAPCNYSQLVDTLNQPLTDSFYPIRRLAILQRCAADDPDGLQQQGHHIMERVPMAEEDGGIWR